MEGSGAPPAEYVVEQGSVVAVRGDHRERLPIEGTVLAVHREGPLLYVARGPLGVTVLDVSDALAPRRVRDVTVPGSATGFHVVEGQLWVVTVSRTAVPLEDTHAAPPAEGARAGALEEPAPVPVVSPRPAENRTP